MTFDACPREEQTVHAVLSGMWPGGSDPDLVAHAAKTRPLCAGTIIGSGTVSNKDEQGGPGRPVGEGGLGYSCIAEIRTIETIRDGKAATPFMRWGDTVGIEMLDEDGHSVFGRIEQEVVRP